MNQPNEPTEPRRRGRTIVSNSEVYQCIVDFTVANPPRSVTKKMVSAALGVAYKLVDEHFERLVDAKKIRKTMNGLYEPVEIRADRAVSCTVVHGAGVKLEVGDGVLDDLSPREVQAVLRSLAGFGPRHLQPDGFC